MDLNIDDIEKKKAKGPSFKPTLSGRSRGGAPAASLAASSNPVQTASHAAAQQQPSRTGPLGLRPSYPAAATSQHGALAAQKALHSPGPAASQLLTTQPAPLQALNSLVQPAPAHPSTALSMPAPAAAAAAVAEPADQPAASVTCSLANPARLASRAGPVSGWVGTEPGHGASRSTSDVPIEAMPGVSRSASAVPMEAMPGASQSASVVQLPAVPETAARATDADGITSQAGAPPSVSVSGPLDMAGMPQAKSRKFAPGGMASAGGPARRPAKEAAAGASAVSASLVRGVAAADANAAQAHHVAGPATASAVAALPQPAETQHPPGSEHTSEFGTSAPASGSVASLNGRTEPRAADGERGPAGAAAVSGPEARVEGAAGEGGAPSGHEAADAENEDGRRGGVERLEGLQGLGGLGKKQRRFAPAAASSHQTTASSPEGAGPGKGAARRPGAPHPSEAQDGAAGRAAAARAALSEPPLSQAGSGEGTALPLAASRRHTSTRLDALAAVAASGICESAPQQAGLLGQQAEHGDAMPLAAAVERLANLQESRPLAHVVRGRQPNALKGRKGGAEAELGPSVKAKPVPAPRSRPRKKDNPTCTPLSVEESPELPDLDGSRWRQHALEAWQALLGNMLEETTTRRGPAKKRKQSASSKRKQAASQAGPSDNQDWQIVPKDGAADKPRSKRQTRASRRSASRDRDSDEEEESSGASQPLRELTVSEQLTRAGLGIVRLPRVDADELVDTETWSLRRIIARSEAWDKQKRMEEKQRVLEEKQNNSEGAPVEAVVRQPVRSQAMAAPRLQIINGQIVVDASSLTVQAQRGDDVTTYTRVEENNRLINTQSYMKKTAVERWGKEDTELFYRALCHFGTDFTLIAQLFPKRDRKHIKNKYNKELKGDANKVNNALEGKGKNAVETKQMFEVMKANILLQQQRNQADNADGAEAQPAAVAEPAASSKAQQEEHPAAMLQEDDPFEETYY